MVDRTVFVRISLILQRKRPNRMWVLYPLYDQPWLAGLAVCLWVVVWALLKPSHGLADGSQDPEDRSGGTVLAVLGYGVLGGLAGLLGWWAQARRIHLGDADVFLHWFETIQGWMPQPHAPLDQWIRQGVLVSFHEQWGIPSLVLYRLVSCATLAVLVWVSLAITHRLRWERRALVLGLIWTGGAIQLGFGYLEIYPLATVLQTVLLLTALQTLERGKGLWIVVCLATLTCLAGTWQVLTLPALGVLSMILHREKRWLIRSALAGLSMLIPLVATVAVVASTGELQDRQSVLSKFLTLEVLPLIVGTTASGDAGLFSWQHLSNVLGELVLLAPALPLVAWLCLVPKHVVWRRVFTRRAALLGAATVLPFVFLLLRNPLGGMPRDWDLFAFLGPPTVLLLTEVLWAIPRARGRIHWIAAAIMMQLCVTGSWIALNHSPETFPKTAERLDGWQPALLSEVERGFHLAAAWREEALWQYVDTAGTLYKEPKEESRALVATIPEEPLQAVDAVSGSDAYWVLEKDGSVARVAYDGAVERLEPPPYVGFGGAKPRRLIRSENAGRFLAQIDSWSRLWVCDPSLPTEKGIWRKVQAFGFEEANRLQMEPDGGLTISDTLGRVQTLAAGWRGAALEGQSERREFWSYDSRRVPDPITPNITDTITGPEDEAIWIHRDGRIEVEGHSWVYDTRKIERRRIAILTGALTSGAATDGSPEGLSDFERTITLIDVKGGKHEVEPARSAKPLQDRIRIEGMRDRPWAAMRILGSALARYPELEANLLPMANEALVNQLAARRVFTRVQIAPFAWRLGFGPEGEALLCDLWGRLALHREGGWRIDSGEAENRFWDIASDGQTVWGLRADGTLLRLESVEGTRERPRLQWTVESVLSEHSADKAESAEEAGGPWRLAVNGEGRLAAMALNVRLLLIRSETGEWSEPIEVPPWPQDVSVSESIQVMDRRGRVHRYDEVEGFATVAEFDFGFGGARALLEREGRSFVVELNGGVHPVKGSGEALPESPYTPLDLYADAARDPLSGELVLLTKNGALERVETFTETGQ